MQAVLGARVAAATALNTGDSFKGRHGLDGAGLEHAEQAYKVTGVLAPCGCVVDRLVLTATESVWQVHQKPQKADEEVDPRKAEAAREVTMVLVGYKNASAAATLPRFVNSTSSMQAAAPGVEVSRLLRLLGVGSEVLRGIGVVLLFSAALSVFIALWNAVRERREDLAMLRMLGATPFKVAALLLCEALWLAVLASIMGLLAGHAIAGVVGYMLEVQRSLPITGRIWLPNEIWIPVSAVALATLTALVPALTAYRVDVSQLLNAR
jgi:putative ABC transport system permease protein